MSVFICEKCGCIDNSALNNNYWMASMAKQEIKETGKHKPNYSKEFEYFETHLCCSECCKGLTFSDGSGTVSNGWHNKFEKKHWSEYGKDNIIKSDLQCNGNMENGIDYLESIGELTEQEAKNLRTKKIRLQKGRR